jgi:hypothetical protein
MARTLALQATLGASTSIATEMQIGDTNEFAACEPCWWIVDLRVNGAVVDNRPGPTAAPTKGALVQLPARADLKVRVDYNVRWSGASNSAYGHSRTFDAIPGRYAFWASTIDVYVLGPADMVSYNPEVPSNYVHLGATILVAYVDVGVSPAPPDGDASNTAQYTHRLAIPAGAPGAATQVAIPNGARRMQVWDVVTWSWLEPTQGTIPTAAGQSDTVLIPSCSRVGPSAAGAARTATAVFEVVL